MIIETRSWKRVGALILGFVSHGFCTRYGASMTIVAGKDSEQNLRVHEEVLDLVLLGYRLEDSLIRENLGNWFPNTEEVIINDVPPCDKISGQDNASGVVAPCTKAKKVVICMSCNGSPVMLEHIKVLFPGAVDLTFASNRAMPIRNLKDAKTCQEKRLEMKEVTRLWVRSNSIAKPEILFENLRLFPNVEDLSLLGLILESATGEDIRKTDLVLSHVKKLNGYDFPVDQGFLSSLPKVFPSVEELWISEGALERMTTRVEEGVDPYFFFEKLTKLDIYPGGESSATSCLRERTSEVFPALSYIDLSSHSVDALERPEDIIPVKTVKTVKISRDLRCPPDFFDELFPELTSLIMSRKGFIKLSQGKSLFHPQLRHLDISGSEELESILDGMEGPQSRSDGAPVGGLDLPCLESLNICRSFECKVPGWFLQGCPRIRRLKMTVDPERYSWDSKGSWWEFLGALLALEEVHVGIIPCKATSKWDGYEVQEDKSGFSGNGLQDIVEGLTRDLVEARRLFKLHASAHFYKYNEFGSEHITSIGVVGKEYFEEAGMDKK